MGDSSGKGNDRAVQGRDARETGEKVDLSEVRHGSFLTNQGDRVVDFDPTAFEPPTASAEPAGPPEQE